MQTPACKCPFCSVLCLSKILPCSTLTKVSCSTTVGGRLTKCILISSAQCPPGAEQDLGVFKNAFILMLSASLQLTSEQQQNRPSESVGHRRVTGTQRRPHPRQMAHFGFHLRDADGTSVWRKFSGAHVPQMCHAQFCQMTCDATHNSSLCSSTSCFNLHDAESLETRRRKNAHCAHFFPPVFIPSLIYYVV